MATTKRPLPNAKARRTVVNDEGEVVSIHKGYKGRLYLREHRKAKGVSAEYMAGRMGMERESLLRLEREAQTRCTPEKQAQYAHALHIEPTALWRLPGGHSLDDMVSHASPEVQAMVVDIVKRMVGK